MSKVSGLFKDLTTVKEARNGRLASWDQRGKNQDYWEIPAKKESITLGEIEGPGCITHIWMTSSCRKVKAPSILDPVQNASAAPVMEIHPALGVIWDDYDPFYYRKALIKITWDDQETPSVLAPFGDFFCIETAIQVTLVRCHLMYLSNRKKQEDMELLAQFHVTSQCHLIRRQKLKLLMKMNFHLFFILILIMKCIKSHWMKRQHIFMLAGIEKIHVMDGDRIFR